ncbi:hypothetical protein Tco_0498629, partial [Tanacetum coccineum]
PLLLIDLHGEAVSCDHCISNRSEAKIPLVLFKRVCLERGDVIECEESVMVIEKTCQDQVMNVKIPKVVEAKMLVYEIENMEQARRPLLNRNVLHLTYQPMAVKKTSFPEIECGGSIDISIPDAVKDQGEALSNA